MQYTLWRGGPHVTIFREVGCPQLDSEMWPSRPARTVPRNPSAMLLSLCQSLHEPVHAASVSSGTFTVLRSGTSRLNRPPVS